MMDSVLLDTSFCIRLIKTDDEYHKNVIEYYNFFLEKKIKLYLSAIVVSEFCIKDELENLPLRTTRFIPFNLDDAVRAAEYERIAKPIVDGVQRNVVRNDCKLIAQIACRGIQGYITKDKASIKKL